MKYLKKFATRAEYEAYVAATDNFPLVAYIKDEKKVEYHPLLDYSLVPFYIKASEDLEVSFSRNTIQYSLDNEAWVDLPVGESTPTIAAGNKVYFRAEGLSPVSTYGIGSFSISGRCDIGGNIMSLLYGDNFVDNIKMKSFAFYGLLKKQPIVNAFNLIMPSVTMAQACCHSMFSGCTSLENAPALPATGMALECYYSMFYGCKSLVNAPALPATVLKTSCYSYMFYGCSNLAYIKMMVEGELGGGSYTYQWVKGVAANGTFVKNAAATWTDTFEEYAIPTGWTVETATE